MSKFKALIVDFDGTLVDHNFYLSPAVKKAVVNLVKKGYVFSLATGRLYQGIVKQICQELQLSSPQIVSGGSKIIDPKTEEILWVEYFPPKAVKDLIAYFLKNNFDFAVEGDGSVFTIKGVLKNYGPNITFKDISQLDDNKISKIVLLNVSLIGDPQKIEEDLGKIYPDLHFVRSGMKGFPLVLDITSKKATKHLAVLELSRILNIDSSLMVGVGDGYNDYRLLSACGYKVAMANAPEELKEIADTIVSDVAEDGLIEVINNLFI